MESPTKRQLPSDTPIPNKRKRKQKFDRNFACSYRGCTFKTKNYNDFSDHKYETHYCNECKCQCVNSVTHRCKKYAFRPLPEVDIKDTRFIEKARANKGAIVSLQHEFKTHVLKIRHAYKLVKKDIFLLLSKYMISYKGIKTKFTFKLDVTELKTGERKIKYYHSAYTRLTNQTFISRVIEDNLIYVENTIEMLNELGSGVKVEGILALEIDISAYQPVKPRGYTTLPAGLKRRKGLLNIKCEQDCFRLCILAALYGDLIKLRKHPDTPHSQLTLQQKKGLKRRMETSQNYNDIIAKVNREQLLDFTGFENTFDLNNLPVWEDRNGVGVTVYEFDEEIADVIQYRFPEKKFERYVSLLLIGGPDNFHLVLIQDPSSFFGKNHGHRANICPHCSTHYKNPSHVNECGVVNELGIKTVQERDKFFRFKHYNKLLPPPYRIYTSLLYCHNNTNNSELKVAGFGVAVLNANGEICNQKFQISENAMEDYLNYIFELSQDLQVKMKKEQLSIPEMNDEDQAIFDQAEVCEICYNKFTSENVKVRHHSHHISGFPIMAVCNNCNLQIKTSNYIPMFSHSHQKLGNQMILQNLKSTHSKNVHIIPKSQESFMAITFDNKLRLVDGRNILDKSLHELIKWLVKSDGAKKLEPFYKYFPPEELKQPFYFPHTWFNSKEKLEDKDVGEEEYQQAKALYEELNCTTFRDYCMMSLQANVYQLAAVFEDIGEWCFKTYNLSPLQDISVASYAMSVAMYHAKASFEIPTDPKIITFVLDNIRGGVSHLSKRLVTARSERLGHTGVKDEERCEILMSDINSLYADCLLNPLPFRDYKFLSPEEIKNLDVGKLNGDTGKGWMINVTLEYPPEIMEKTKDFPLCPTKEVLAKLSDDFMDLNLDRENSMKQIPGLEALVLTQTTKHKQGIHYRLLQFYLEMGMKISEIHGVLQFEERPFLRDFINMNLNVRKSSPDKIHQQISKSINNMVFGKMLSINSNLEVKVLISQAQAIASNSKHNSKDVAIVSEDVSLGYVERPYRKIDKNILVGAAVLDLAKLRLYELIYKELKPKFGDRMYVCSSLTDSLVCEIKDPNKTYIQDLKDLEHIFDFSTLPENHPLYDNSKAMQSGLLKIEYPYPIEFAAVKSKVYSVLNKCQSCLQEETHDSLQCEKCENKSVSKGCSRRKKTPHETYVRAILEEEPHEDTTNVDFYSFQSINQKVSYQKTTKKVFVANDRSRKWISNIESVPYGYIEPEYINSTDG